MKKTILVIATLFPLFGFSQQTIQLSYDNPTEVQESSFYNRLNGIISLTLSCRDTAAIGKKFNIRREEIVDGKTVKTDSLISCKGRHIPVVMKKDTMYYAINLCDRVRFDEDDSVFKIMFGGKFKNDSIYTLVEFPSISADDYLYGNSKYLFKPLQKTDENNGFQIQSGEDYPIIALTPPFNMGSGFGSYCLIDTKQPRNFYEDFKIAHYFIYYLKVE